ncbi:MAG: CocE/NonD family hydrolase, partial [Microthrixaceae bacterium]|nr:CocE/NonD family hydrolase [Microthrixaceae bacterium]
MVPPASSTSRAGFKVLAGIEQIYVIGAAEGDKIEVSSPGGATVSGAADRLGSLAIRDLEQGHTYTVTNVTAGTSTSVRVLVATENPTQSFYAKTKLREGMNYIPMRDGITLAAVVRPPLGQSLADGPFPTVIEYSGYQIAAPNEPLWSKLGTQIGLEADPLAPAESTDVGSLLMRLAGFATVSVQMRGSGCSGGEADLFDLPTRYDGYDAVETVAAQDWVTNGKVGMVGISFSGFSQIATASTHPPHLAAIAPLSFVGSLYDLGHPGGIFNNGFSESWLKERQQNAKPAPDPEALPYANFMVQTDSNCRDNQRLRLQTRDGIAMVKDNDVMGPIYERRDFRPWMSQIEVPTFASLQFNDEETSPYAILSASDLLNANPNVWLNLANGHHRDAVSPDTITQMFEFLDIYVARRPPQPKIL